METKIDRLQRYAEERKVRTANIAALTEQMNEAKELLIAMPDGRANYEVNLERNIVARRINFLKELIADEQKAMDMAQGTLSDTEIEAAVAMM